MAAGDFTVFSQAKIDLGNKVFNLATDSVKFALVTAVVTPAEADAGPHFGGTGTTNYATNQVTPGGSYATGGPALTTKVFNASGANAKWDADDVSITQNVLNPTNARWAILYDDTDANKRAVGFLDLGVARDLTTGLFTVTWAAAGIFTLS